MKWKSWYQEKKLKKKKKDRKIREIKSHTKYIIDLPYVQTEQHSDIYHLKISHKNILTFCLAEYNTQFFTLTLLHMKTEESSLVYLSMQTEMWSCSVRNSIDLF